MEMTTEQREELLKLGKEFNDKLSLIAEEKGQKNGKPNSDVIDKSALDNMQKDILEKIESINKKLASSISSKVKFVYGGAGQLGEGEKRISFGTWLKMLKYKHPAIAEEIFAKTSMNEGIPAQGGYTVPVEYESMIYGELNNPALLINKMTKFPQGTLTKQIPKWLTDLAVQWVAEEGDKPLSKPTLTYKNSVLHKMAVIVKMTDEYLDDDISNMPAQVSKLVAQNFATELQRVALIGSTVGGDPFNGIYFSTPSTVNMIGANLAYQDIINTWNNTNVLENYRTGCEWMMNRTGFGYVMGLVDLQGRPLWNIATINGAPVPTLLGDPVNICQEITNTLGVGLNHTTIMYGNPKHVLLGEKSGNGGIEVTVSNEAIMSSQSAVLENFFMQDLTGYRFKIRRSVVVVNPEAFSVLLEVV
jgi:HK97 family phage major capsid protein